MALNFSSLQNLYQNPPPTTKPLFSTGMPVFNPNQTSPDPAPGAMPAPEVMGSSAPALPNYQANTDVGAGFGGTILNRLANPGILEDVQRGGLGGNIIQPQVIADLNRRVASGEITQEQANSEWAKMREAGAEAQRAADTSSRQFQQRGLTTIGTIAAGGYLGGLSGGAAGAAAGGVDGTVGSTGAVSPPLDATQDPLGSGGDPGNAVSGAGGARGATGAGSALSRIIDGTATTADYVSVLGGAAGTGLGIAGSINQQNALQDLAKQQMSMGAPYRDKLAALYADPNSFLKSAEVTAPVQQGTDALSRSLSVQGNPIGSGHALQELQNYSANQLFGKLGQEKDRLAGYGGLTAYNAAAPGTALAGVNAGANVYNAVGSGIANLTNPQPSLVDLYRSMREGHI